MEIIVLNNQTYSDGMKKINYSLFVTTMLLLLFTINATAQLNVNYITATQFVQNLAGPNVNFINAVFTGTDPMQVASFSGPVSPAIGIASGVMLATGDAMVAADTTNNCTAGTSLGGGGDADLSGACQQQTKDLAAVEFDFWVPTDTVSFTFMFASEEYNYWVFSKNDVCGARLYNSVGGYANVIYIPGTFTPVCVNSINNGLVTNICDPSTGPCLNCSYFNDNTFGSTFQYNGYTNLITVKFHVNPCDTFHFWLGIADAQDFIYDSAILLPDNGFIGVGSDNPCDSITAINAHLPAAVNLNIFPNPFADKVLLTMQKPNVKPAAIIVTDIYRKIIYKEEDYFFNSAQPKSIDLSFLSRGIYFLEIVADGELIIKRIVKEH